MRIQLKCGSEERRQAIRDSNLNAIDYLEVLPRTETIPRPLLLLYCFKPDFPSEIQADDDNSNKNKNILIEGGVRIKDLGVEWLQVAETIIENLDDEANAITKDLADEEKNAIQNIEESDRNRILIIRPTRDGDFSMYTLRLIRNPDNRELPPSGFDRILSHIDFTFKVLCPIHFDCKVERECPPEIRVEPVIDYMAKDYASFRRLMLDRMAAIMPTWRERNPADLGIVLVELLAYVGDHLSYYQDAVATEAYLGTARRRVSMRRHARLLNYFMHEGCNARSWIHMNVSGDIDLVDVPEKTKLLTGIPNPDLVVREENFDQAIREGGAEVFETMHNISLHRNHNEILFYTWAEPKCCLPKGATHTTLKNDSNKLDVYLFNWNDIPGSDNNALKDFLEQNFAVNWIEDLDIEKIVQGTEEEITISDGVRHLSIVLSEDKAAASLIIEGKVMLKFTVKQEDADLKVYTLSLKVGDYMLFEEVRSPSTFAKADADPSHRHVVRLTKVEPDIDELNGNRLVEIAWDAKDAMPFPLCLWEVPKPEGEEEGGEGDGAIQLKQLSVARGNIVLADHGNTVRERLQDRYDCGRFRPLLSLGPLTHRGPFDRSSPASSLFAYEMQEVTPDIYIEEYKKEIDCKNVEGEEEENAIRWFATRDLLSSNRFSRDFVVEIENDDERTAQIRFGDDILGMEPEPSTEDNPHTFCAVYRVGNGIQGNVGAESIKRIVRTKNFLPSGIAVISNPMPAKGGKDHERLDEVRQYAPQAFRKQERAVTESDYTEVLKRHSGVQRAAAMLRWTGSWYTVFVTIDRYGGKEVDENFKEEIRRHLERYRLAGYDVEINAPLYAPLYIEMKVCVCTDYFRDKVEQELLKVFSNHDLPDGRRGFFHPDNTTFGQSVYLSRIYETAMRIQGVCSVTITKFERLNKKQSGDALQEGAMRMGMFEIARLDMDRNRPENGRIDFRMEGGQ